MSGVSRTWEPETVYQEIPLPSSQWNLTSCHTGEMYQFTFSPERLFWIPGDSIRQRLVEWIIERKGHFEVVKSYVNETTGDVVVTAQVIDNPLPFLVVFGIIVTGSTLVLAALGLTLTKVTRLVESPAGAAAVGSFSLATLAAVAIGAKYLLFK